MRRSSRRLLVLLAAAPLLVLVFGFDTIHRAGADFALSISEVSGQILAQRLLGGEGVLLDPKLRLLRVDVAPLLGQRLGDLDLRHDLGITLAAVECGDEDLTTFGPDFRFEAGDRVYVCGSDPAIQAFFERYPLART